MIEQRRPVHGASRAFTLIELLVVIAIIAVLAAIALPVYNRVQQSAKQTQSLSNLKQIAAAANLFANDNGDLLPKGYYYVGTTELTYPGQLAAYIGDNKSRIFVSPTSMLLPVATASTGYFALTYSMNNAVCPDTSKGTAQVHRSSIGHPSQVILIGDGCQIPSSTNYSRCTFSQPPVSAGAVYDLDQPIPVGPDADTAAGASYLRYRNNGGVAVAMVDGHAEIIKKGSVLYRNIVPNW